VRILLFLYRDGAAIGVDFLFYLWNMVACRNEVCVYGRRNTTVFSSCFRNQLYFCSLDHAFLNYDERKTNEIYFQSEIDIINIWFTLKINFVGLSFIINQLHVSALFRVGHHQVETRISEKTHTVQCGLTYLSHRDPLCGTVKYIKMTVI
jgi:hypothetical protein